MKEDQDREKAQFGHTRFLMMFAESEKRDNLNRLIVSFSATAIFQGQKKAPILRLGLSKFGRHKQIRTADLYHVKVAL